MHVVELYLHLRLLHLHRPLLARGTDQRDLVALFEPAADDCDAVGASRDLEEEPQRVREFYNVRVRRIEPVGLVYLWPETN